MDSKTIRINFSPDSDDFFMFYAIICNKIDLKNYQFSFHQYDTETLNRKVLSDEVDISAISIHNYAYVQDKYQLLPHGGSCGENYGPVLVSKVKYTLTDLYNKRIGIPGKRTTAYLVLKLILPQIEIKELAITPYTAMFTALEKHDVDAVLLIHEGRLTYPNHGYHKIIDIGEWWFEKTSLPLALGGNIIRKALGDDVIHDLSEILRLSIRYALDHKNEVIDYILSNDTRQEAELKQRTMIDRYLDMYANERTFDYGNEGRKAVELLLDMGYKAGIIPHATEVEFAV